MRTEADLLILGAGCAGLSLAWNLAERGLAGRRVLLLEPRLRYERDRTWCSWNVEPHAFSDLAPRRYGRWRVRAPDGPWVERGAPGLSYDLLPSDAFYERVLGRLRGVEGLELRLGVRAGAVRDRGSHVEVETDAGVVTAKAVFDSRPPSLMGAREPGRRVAYLQHFEGWFVDAPGAGFDPGVATLMDFAVPQTAGGGVHFVYVLPETEDRALVEATWFGTGVASAARYQESLERYLREALGLARWTVTGRERGVIPMSTDAFEARPSERVYRIGLAGGLAKPSTGYAFAAIQRFSRELARRLDERELPDPPAPRPWLSRFQDRVFLSYLSRNEDRAAQTLVDLFERVPPRRLAEFLSDRASLREGVAVMKALPRAQLTMETARSAPLWLRR